MELLFIIIVAAVCVYEIIEKLANKKESKKREENIEKVPAKPICTMEPLILDNMQDNNNQHT